MRIILTIALGFIITLSSAQTPPLTAPKTKKPAQWADFSYRNEIGVDVSPLLSLMISNPKTFDHVSIVYKRYLDRNDILRVGAKLGYDIYTSYFTSVPSINQQSPSPRPNQWLQEDTFVQQINQKNVTLTPTLHIGYEHRFGKRRIKGILGVDIIAGVEVFNEERTIERFEKFTVLDSVVNYTYTGYYSVKPTEQLAYRSISALVGISPFVGMYAHLVPYFSLSAHLGYDLYYSFPLKTTSSQRYDGFNLNTDAFIADVSLIYVFGKNK